MRCLVAMMMIAFVVVVLRDWVFAVVVGVVYRDALVAVVDVIKLFCCCLCCLCNNITYCYSSLSKHLSSSFGTHYHSTPQ